MPQLSGKGTEEGWGLSPTVARTPSFALDQEAWTGRPGQACTTGPQGKADLCTTGQPQGRPQPRASSGQEAEDVRAVALGMTEATPHCRCLRQRLLRAEVSPGHLTAEWALCQSFEGANGEFLIQTSEIDTSLHSNGCECIKKGGACLACCQRVKEALGEGLPDTEQGQAVRTHGAVACSTDFTRA